MTDKPLVSVVITTYFRNESLEDAIESVLAQTYDNVEILVVDGSEVGHAAAVVADYDVRYLPLEVDEGAQASRSFGAEAANGRYINFLDDDDRFVPDKLEKQLEVLRENDNVGVVYCGIEWGNGHQVLPDPRVRGDVLEYALKFQMTPSSPSTMLINSEVLAELLPLAHRHGADDMGTKIDLAQRTAFDFVDEALVYKGFTGDSLGGSFENIHGRHELLCHFDGLYGEFPKEVKREAVSHTYLLEADILNDEYTWSARAIWCAVLANYYVPGVRLPFVGYLLATLGGRIGRNLGRFVYERTVLGDTHRGKLT